MKYKEVDWSKWQSVPTETTYLDWCKIRKAKMTQTAINRTAPHINKLLKAGISAEEAVAIAADNEWRGIKYQWVLKAISRDMEALSDFEPSPRSTREISLTEQLTSRDWADDH